MKIYRTLGPNYFFKIYNSEFKVETTGCRTYKTLGGAQRACIKTLEKLGW